MRGSCECAHDKFIERDVKLVINGLSGASGTSKAAQRNFVKKKEKKVYGLCNEHLFQRIFIFFFFSVLANVRSLSGQSKLK